MQLFNDLGVNQNIIYFNPGASVHTIPTKPTSPLHVPTLPSSRTREILMWLDIIDICFLNLTNMQTLMHNIHGVVEFLLMENLQKNSTTKNDNFDNFLFSMCLEIKQFVMHASYATHINLVQKISCFSEKLCCNILPSTLP